MEKLPKNIESDLDNATLNTNALDLIDHPVLKGLIAFVSGHPVVAGTLLEVITKTWGIIQKQKEINFFEELNKDPSKLHEGLLKSEEFIQKFLITYRAVILTSSNEKIKNLARFLATNEETTLTIDEYEEMVNILVELADVEIYILKTLDDFESSIGGYADQTPHDKNAANDFWEKFIDIIAEIIPIEEIKPRLNRLQRTGLYQNFGPMTIDEIGDLAPISSTADGYLTPLYYKLKKLVLLEAK